jgi:hypothetical protein
MGKFTLPGNRRAADINGLFFSYLQPFRRKSGLLAAGNRAGAPLHNGNEARTRSRNARQG